MAVTGIFTKWEFDLLEKPETLFKRNLDINPTFPFVPLRPGLYALRVTSARWAIGVIFMAITILITVFAFGTSSEIDEFMVFPVLVLLCSFFVTLSYAKAKVFVLDAEAKMYEFYRGNRLIYRGHVHNLYIRLKGQNSGGGDTYYQVVLDGYLVDEEPITGSTTRKDRLAKLARRLSARLNINFFDSTDKSRYHVIRHRCPYATDSTANV